MVHDDAGAARRDLESLIRSSWAQVLDQNILLVGGERAVGAALPWFIPRVTASKVPYSELQRILARLGSFSEWVETWSRSADRYRQMGETALLEGKTQTGAHFLLLATYLYFFAQLLLPMGNPTKESIVRRMVSCYLRGAAELAPPVRPVRIPFNGVEMPGYLRVPDTPGRAPCVVMLDGADTVKEELHWWSDLFVQRGAATLCFDGPGQGETWAQLKMDARYEVAVSAAIDWLRAHDAIDPSRIVIWGISLGGYLAARALASDDRAVVGVCVGGFYDARGFPHRALAGQERWREMLGLPDIPATRNFVAEHVTLSGMLADLGRPLLVVHGGRDHLVPTEEIRCFLDDAPDMVEFWLYEDACHAVWDWYEEVAPRTADWVMEALQAYVPVPTTDQARTVERT